MSQQSDLSSIPALDRAIDILEYIGQLGKPVTVKELSIKLDIPISSCFRTVKKLLTRGYLIEDSTASGQYGLGYNILKISNQLLNSLNVRNIALPAMRKIADSENHTVQLGIIQDKNAMIIEQIIPSQGVSVVAPTGAPIPINVCAAGKIICAYLPSDLRRKTVYEASLLKYTENSIIDKDLFIKELEAIAERGYSTDNEEYSIGVSCLAVPIFDHNSFCIAAIGTVGQALEYQNKQKQERLLNTLKMEASRISELMGYRSL